MDGADGVLNGCSDDGVQGAAFSKREATDAVVDSHRDLDVKYARPFSLILPRTTRPAVLHQITLPSVSRNSPRAIRFTRGEFTLRAANPKHTKANTQINSPKGGVIGTTPFQAATGRTE